MTNVPNPTDTSNQIDVDLLAKIVSDSDTPIPVNIAAAALDRIADDIAMMQIAEEAEGGITDEFRQRHLCAIQSRATAVAEAVRRLARPAPGAPPAPKWPGENKASSAYPSELRDALQEALAGVAGARSILPSDEPDFAHAKAQLTEAVDSLGFALSIVAEREVQS